jgi:hypothetical protein
MGELLNSLVLTESRDITGRGLASHLWMDNTSLPMRKEIAL